MSKTRTGHTRSAFIPFLALVVCCLLFSAPEQALAFQSHDAPEGLYGHQLAHAFFIVAMAILVYWLELNRLTANRAWRLIEISCALLLLWNLWAMIGHWVEELIPDASLAGEPDWSQRLRLNLSPWTRLYYVLKFDHLVCLPAIVCLYLGIRGLCERALTEERRTGE